jgi:hypothetical protein
MNSKTKPEVLRFPLNLLHYGNSYYLERIAALETALRGRPTVLQLELLGDGEITPGWALLIRDVLREKSPDTWVTTHARSSLRGATVLVWLLGEHRLIREDAHLFFRRAKTTVTGEPDEDTTWEESDTVHDATPGDADPEEAEYARVLQCINEFLPVQELAGKLIEAPLLRQFGLVENEKLDRFLADAFRDPQAKATPAEPNSKPAKTKADGAGTLKQ